MSNKNALVQLTIDNQYHLLLLGNSCFQCNILPLQLFLEHLFHTNPDEKCRKAPKAS